MTEMSQYVCWTDGAVRAVTPRDAASLLPGHFQAVHHPLKLRRRRLGSRGGGSWVEESEIVRVLEGPLRADGYIFVPIVGGSGTGKSHLVKWVSERTHGRDNWESRYLAKNRTSIRRVIEIVIEGLEGPAIEAAREALLRAPAQSENERVLAERLLDELALITSEESVAESDAGDRGAAQMAAKLRRELPDILRDPVVRRRLTADGAVIQRLVGLATRGRTDGDGLDDDAKNVVDDDLPLSFENIGEASKGAQKLLTQMAGNPAIRSAAVSLINAAVPAAVKRVFVSGKVDLTEVFREVRRALLADGKELVLFIEDLTVLHGVEREFLDAIVEPARSPDGDMCALRLLFAVTEGHFKDLDTVRTRCDDAYWLDASYGADGVGAEEAVSFLARYLNACRHEPGDLDERWSNRQGGAWLPNACTACEHQVHCHQTFGASEEGYGLYPFNAAAVDRFVMALSRQRFDPRDVVRELVNRFLIVAASDLPRGEFPSSELVALFDERSDPLDPVVEAELKSLRPSDSARVVNSIRYWSDASGTVGDATLAAFGLGPLDELHKSATPRPVAKAKPRLGGANQRSNSPETTAGSAAIESRLQSPWSAIFDELNLWAGNNRDLSASATNNLKKLVHKSIAQSLDLSALPVNIGSAFEDQKRFDRERHVVIAGSVTTQHRADPMVTIEQDADSAAALQGLILLAEFPEVANYRNADTFRRQTARYLEKWTLSVTQRLEQPPEAAATSAIAGLVACSIVSGACDAASEPHDYLAALFGGGDSFVNTDRTTRWQALVEAADDTYRRLRPVVEANFGESRGTGAVRAVRADQILTVIEELTKTWPFESTDSATDRFMRLVAPAVEDEWSLFEQRAVGATPFVEPDRPWSEQTERVLELVDAAHRAGRLRDHDAARDLKALADSADDNSHRRLLDAAELVSAGPPLIERLRAIASDLSGAVAAASRFVVRADQALSTISRDLDERRSAHSDDEILEDVAAGVVAAVDRLAAVIEELEK